MSSFPLSQFKWAGNLLFVSGKIGTKGDSLVSDNLEEQIIQTCDNIKETLGQNGMNLKNVVDATVFLVDQNDYAAFNEIYRKVFEEPYPTRTVVTVKSLPVAARVEIKVIAAKSEPPVVEV